MTKDGAEAAPAKRGRDVTRTERQVAHLDRLEQANGKRIVVDLDAASREALEALIESGYGTSQAAVVRQALIDVAKRKKVA
jgi:hypothetical protein